MFESKPVARSARLVNLAVAALIATSAVAPAGATDLSALSLGPNTIADIAESAAPAVVCIEAMHRVKHRTAQGGFPFFMFDGQQPPGSGPRSAPTPSRPGNRPPNAAGIPADNDRMVKINPKNRMAMVDPNKPDTARNGGADPGKGAAGSADKAEVKAEAEEDFLPSQRDTGSGFIIKPDGYILTNRHVIDGADKIEVTLNDKRKFPAKVIGADKMTDLAVIKIDADKLPTLKMGNSSQIRPGEFVIAIGNPLGFDHSVTFGIVSATGRTVQQIDRFRNINFIQTDAAINPGNSGGPLLNLKGEVIGVNTAINQTAQNIGFSVPIDQARTVSDQLIANGTIQRPWVGIMMLEMDADTAKKLGWPDETKGILVNNFVAGSPAKESGLQIGDVIQKIDGKEIAKTKELKEYVEAHKVGDVLHVLVLRNKALSPQTFDVKIGDYQQAPKEHGNMSGISPRSFPPGMFFMGPDFNMAPPR